MASLRALIIFVLLPLNCWAETNTIGIDCIVMPAFPLFGTLQASGSFVVTLVCPDAGMDLPLNAPGDNGVLFCDPKEQNYELSEVVVPDCVPLRLANAVHLPLLLVFTAASCFGKFEDVVTLYRNTYFPKFDKLDTTLRLSSWSAPHVKCDKNKVFKDGNDFQIDVQFSLITPHSGEDDFKSFSQTLETYREELIQFRHSEKLAGHWNRTAARLMAFDIGMWSAYCEEVASSKGTVLALHHVAACRGCSRSYYYSMVEDKCIQCGFNYYTETPYAPACIRCPEEATWGNRRAEMLMLCYGRQ